MMQNIWPVVEIVHPDYKPDDQMMKRDLPEKRATNDVYRQ